MFDFLPQPQQRYIYMPSQPQTIQPPAIPQLPEIPKLKINVPNFNYSIPKILTIPFDKKLCNDGKFATYEEAFDFVARHVQRYHGQITKPLIRAYLPLIQIYDQCEGIFVPASTVCRRDFDYHFKKIVQKQ